MTIKTLATFVMAVLASAQIHRLGAADVTADQLTVLGDATIAGATGFGTVYTGLLSAPTSAQGFRFSVAQGTENVPVEVTHSSWVNGYFRDELVTVVDYGWVPGGFYQQQYVYQVIGQEWVPSVFDENGIEIQAGYPQDIWGNVWVGEYWVTQDVWGVAGSHNETTQVWVDGHTNTWTATESAAAYGAPRLEFKATRSDANWVWQVPASGTTKDVLIVWDGGLRIPSTDTNRMMSLTADNFTQSMTYSGDDGSGTTFTGTVHTKSTAQEIKANDVALYSDEQEIEYDNVIRPEYLRLANKIRNGSTETTVQTQIAATNATFGGVVQVAGNLNVQGVVRVRPAGDLDMGMFTNGIQP